MSETTYLRRKEQGLCVLCGSEKDNNYVLCDTCRDKQSKKRKDDREWYKAHNICPRCKTNRLYGDEKNCIECQAKMYEVNNKCKDKKGRDNVKAYLRDYSKQRVKRLKEEGKCIKCAKRDAVNNRTMCSICLAKNRNRMCKVNIKRFERASYGLCYICGNENDLTDSRLCSKCKAMAVNNLPKDKDSTNHTWRNDNRVVFHKNVGKGVSDGADSK